MRRYAQSRLKVIISTAPVPIDIMASHSSAFFHSTTKKKLAALKLNETTPTELLVFLDNPDYGIAANALRYRIVPFSLHPQRQIAGQLSFLNLSGFQLVAKVNHQIQVLKQNSQFKLSTQISG